MTIRARTSGEVRAYEQGYTQAVLDMRKHGLDFAIAALQLMHDTRDMREKEKKNEHQLHDEGIQDREG